MSTASRYFLKALKKIDFFFKEYTGTEEQKSIYELEKNRIKASNRKILNNLIEELGNQLKKEDIVVTISKATKKRTLPQNSYFHVLLGIVSEASGWDADKLKRDLKIQIGLIEDTIVDGKMYHIVRSTADLNTTDFGKLIDAIIQMIHFLNSELEEDKKIRYFEPSHYGMDFNKK